MNAKECRAVNRTLAGLTNPALPLQDFLYAASAIDERICTALEGIYCGRTGRTVEMVDDRHSITVGWYEGKVEYAYVN